MESQHYNYIIIFLNAIFVVVHVWECLVGVCLRLILVAGSDLVTVDSLRKCCVRLWLPLTVAEDVFQTTMTILFGLYEFVRMPFRLRNDAPSLSWEDYQLLTSSKIMFITSKNTKEQKDYLYQFSQRLFQFGLKINIDKYIISASKITFLIHQQLMYFITTDASSTTAEAVIKQVIDSVRKPHSCNKQ